MGLAARIQIRPCPDTGLCIGCLGLWFSWGQLCIWMSDYLCTSSRSLTREAFIPRMKRGASAGMNWTNFNSSTSRSSYATDHITSLLRLILFLLASQGCLDKEKKRGMLCSQNQSSKARRPVGTTQRCPLILQLKKQDPKVKKLLQGHTTHYR